MLPRSSKQRITREVNKGHVGGRTHEIGEALEIALRGRVVMITKHDTPKAVLVSLDDFKALTRSADRTLDVLSGEFDAMLARMQTPKARAGMKAAFEASGKELGRAAVAAARKRG